MIACRRSMRLMRSGRGRKFAGLRHASVDRAPRSPFGSGRAHRGRTLSARDHSQHLTRQSPCLPRREIGMVAQRDPGGNFPEPIFPIFAGRDIRSCTPTDDYGESCYYTIIDLVRSPLAKFELRDKGITEFMFFKDCAHLTTPEGTPIKRFVRGTFSTTGSSPFRRIKIIRIFSKFSIVTYHCVVDRTR